MPAMDYSQVAQFYDAYTRTNFDLPFFLEEAKGVSHVLELMSGTGRLSVPLIEAGVTLTCVDSSPKMLALLNKKLVEKGLSATVTEMDVCNLSLAGQFDLIIIPFHSFEEVVERNDQRKALAGIRRLLSESGRFICTLHNPPVKLRSVNGKLTQLGKYPLPEGNRTLLLSTVQHYDADNHIVRGKQFYEVFCPDGAMCSKSSVDVQFYLHEKDNFEYLVQFEGFEVINLYGDYSRGTFDGDKSPFMIWVLAKKHASNNFVERSR